MHVRRAFTLVELLVVVFIVAVLIALISTAASRARAVAVAMRCAVNQKQLVMAWLNYAVEHNGQTVRSTTVSNDSWQVHLQEYLDGNVDVYRCPAAYIDLADYGIVITYPFTEYTGPPIIPGSATRPYYFTELTGQAAQFVNMGGYAYNNWLETDPGGQHRQINNIDDLVPSSHVPVFGDGTMPNAGCVLETDRVPADIIDPETQLESGDLRRFTLDRHDKAVNMVFLDGSARRVKLDELLDLYWHKNWDVTKTVGDTGPSIN